VGVRWSSRSEAGGPVEPFLEISRPYCLPGEEVGCTLVIHTQRPLRYKAISAELTCCEKFFVKSSRLTRIPHRCVVSVSGPGIASPPSWSVSFSIRVPDGAKPTYVGSSILRVWRVKALIELGLAPNISVGKMLFVLGPVSRESRRSASVCRGPVCLSINLVKGLFLPGEALRGSVFLSHPQAARSLRIEVLAIERLRVGQLGEISLARCLRKAFLPVRRTAPFSLKAPSYSSFADTCSSVTYVLKAVASLRTGEELVADLPISIGVLRLVDRSGGAPQGSRGGLPVLAGRPGPGPSIHASLRLWS